VIPQSSVGANSNIDAGFEAVSRVSVRPRLQSAVAFESWFQQHNLVAVLWPEQIDI
jgi:hypothetical protein